VWQKFSDVSEKHAASIFRAEKCGTDIWRGAAGISVVNEPNMSKEKSERENKIFYRCGI
jgi:hypothetical protein